MTPGDPAAPPAEQITIDDIFRRHVARHPDALALVDSMRRDTFAGGEPRRLSYADTDRIVSAIATRLRQMGLPGGAVVAVQLPNVAENILTILGVLRAGMIVATLPLLCRRVEAVSALNRTGAKALITCGRIGGFNQIESAMAVAAEVFSVRYVGSFGPYPPDGVVAFDDVFTAMPAEPAVAFAPNRPKSETARLAAITFEVIDGSFVPVARNHAQLLAGGMAVVVESGLAQDSNILSTVVPSSFGGICLTLLPWLMSGGTLVLQHPLDYAGVIQRAQDARCGALIVPGPVASLFAATNALIDGPSTVIATWRSPQTLAASPRWHNADVALTDVPIFGEIALAPARRGEDGLPKSLPNGTLVVPRDASAGVAVAQFGRTAAGTLAARGAMVPRHSFPLGIDRSGLPHIGIGSDGTIDTGYVCRLDAAANALVITGPPSGAVEVGGYRFALNDLRSIVGRIDRAAALTAEPDPILGHRLIGTAAHRKAMQTALNALGINPILAAAFDEAGGNENVRPL